MEALGTLPAFILVFLLGSAIGSFLNVVVYRIPEGLSIFWPPSRCPKCGYRLKATENIPILGWLRLRGRCSNCRQPISVRYPLVETVTGLLFLLIYWQFGLSVVQTVGYWALFSWLLALALIDIDTMTLPNALTKSGLVLGIVFQGVMAGIPGIIGAVTGAVLGIWLFDLVTLGGSLAFGQAAMGGGDAKLAAMMGAWLGWQLLLLAGFLACLLGAVGGTVAIALGWLSRRQPMPFGPFLALGTAIAALWGEWIVSTYLQFFFS
ncbi:prepilin peptidase [Desertifilum sp. FACHB-1129]|uniref:Prepilin leader peptidase/N-methyltransferase n=1 Tax=Desertifilum tharense IPPAS B-1220 TaxID=1781255 RepID=A0A1E5QK71_9CYAN|nr:MULTISPECIES: A24 family peptidase [unclassified Desertifilum]MDA0210449.1 prepilin peptidase [Cyanobacteria bacterium FC1]OEJ75008.1 methyltransferase [Desertifilum tharense IPPAS B-1220]MBD2313914.1 prepilin peptidase [Desertifilum sp. FACHB-1129]MBD2324746.1 prepilin peptidase [Desertifilum sp. FACHB-866]MBD2334860.1 prepilin peptidase [Desertifilum sp. FACHB-868]